MRYEYITKIEIKFDKKKTFKRKSIKYLQNFIFQESVKLPGRGNLNVKKVNKNLQIRNLSLSLQSLLRGKCDQRVQNPTSKLLESWQSGRMRRS